ncbi:myelin protein zero [Sarotherodon galilaeus]
MTSRPQSYIEGEDPDSQHAKSKRGSKVTTEKVALLVLCFLLAVAFVVIYRLSFEHMRTKKMLKNLEGLKKECECVIKNQNVTESKPCSQPEVKINEPCSKCGEGWEHHGGKCYNFSVSKSSWTESRGECRAKGGDLVKIDSREEQKFLDQRLKDIMNYPQDKFWFGLTDSAEEGRWLWVDGSLLDKSLIYWGYNEPDDWKGDYPDGEDCGRMGVKGETSDLNSWFDASCNVAHRSICEKPEITGQPTKASVQI